MCKARIGCVLYLSSPSFFILKFLKKKKKSINKRKKFELAGDSSYPKSSYPGSPVLLLPFPQEFHFLLEFITFQRVSVRASRSSLSINSC